MRIPNLHTTWAELFCASLAEAGVRDVVISPGSRSTPYVLAATRQRDMRCHPIVDEGAAAFFALGQSKTTGHPSLLICTSGTAGAHCLPAIIEASESCTPLLILTADRPPELHHRGASQTIDQVKLFGSFVRLYAEIGLPDADPRALAGLRMLASRASYASYWPRPGPVHLNAWLRKPLEPEPADAALQQPLRETVLRLLSKPLPLTSPPRAEADAASIAMLAERCRTSARGVIVCGPGPLQQRRARAALLSLASACGYPVLAESSSQFRFGPACTDPPFCSSFEALLSAASFRRAHPAELIIQVGCFPVSRGIASYIADQPAASRFVLGPHGWHDPANSADAVIGGELDGILAALEATLAAEPPDPDRRWMEAWCEADRQAWVLAEELLESGGQAMSEPAAVRTVLEHLPENSVLVLGNSLPVREADMVCPGLPAPIDVVTQRGASGIDGLVSCSAGVASVAKRPVTALVGDVACLHDLHGFLVAGRRKDPLVIVILNNRGGRLFDQLPLADVPETRSVFERFFVAEDRLDFHGVAKMVGLTYSRVANRADLADALTASYGRADSVVIEVAADADSSASFRKGLVEHVEARWLESPPVT